jgi:hypothetical protein
MTTHPRKPNGTLKSTRCGIATNTIVAFTLAVALWTGSSAQAQTPRISWAEQLTGSANDFYLAQSAAMDGQGNIYFGGVFNTPVVSFGELTLTNLSLNFDINNGYEAVNGFVAKYNASGSLLWVRQVGSDHEIFVDGCASDAAGNVFITGYVSGSNAWFGTNLISNAGSLFALYVAKFDPQGNFLWAQEVEGDISGSALAVDGAGNLRVAGGMVPTNVVFGTNYFESSAPAADFIAEYNTDGDLLWVKAVIFSDYNRFLCFAADSAGNSYISDAFDGTADFGTLGLTNSYEGNGENLFLAKYDPAGNLLWANSIGASPQGIGALALGVGPGSDCHVLGAYLPPGTATIGTNVLPIATSSSANGFVAKYDSLGNLSWVNPIVGGQNNFGGPSVIVDPMDTCWAIGYASGSILDFGGGVRATNSDIMPFWGKGFVARYQPSGNPLWAKILDSPEVAVIPVGVLDSTGSLFLYGVAGGSNTLNLDGIIVNGPTNGSSYFFAAKIDGPVLNVQSLGAQVVISWPTNAVGLSLESITDLSSGNWSPVTNAPAVVGDQYSVTNNVSIGSQFYRLRNF